MILLVLKINVAMTWMSFMNYLEQQISLAIKRGNAASVVGTFEPVPIQSGPFNSFVCAKWHLYVTKPCWFTFVPTR